MSTPGDFCARCVGSTNALEMANTRPPMTTMALPIITLHRLVLPFRPSRGALHKHRHRSARPMTTPEASAMARDQCGAVRAPTALQVGEAEDRRVHENDKTAPGNHGIGADPVDRYALSLGPRASVRKLQLDLSQPLTNSVGPQFLSAHFPATQAVTTSLLSVGSGARSSANRLGPRLSFLRRCGSAD